MAATLGTVRSAKGTGTTLTATTVVPAGSNRVLYAWVFIRSSSATVSSVAFGGVALTLVDTAIGGSGSTAVRLELWRLIAPSTSSASVVATLSQGPSNGGMLLVEPWSDVDQTTPNSAMSKSSGSSNAPSLTIASASGEVVADAVVHGLLTGNPFTFGANQTEDFDDAQTAMSGAASHEAGAASVTMSWTATASGQWAQGAIAVRSATSDVNAPSSVSTLVATPARAGTQIDLTWTNPSDSDLDNIVIRRRTDAFPTSPTDGTGVTYSGANTPSAADSQSDTGLTNGTLYYYTVYAADVAPNYSAGVTVAAVAHTPPALSSPAADAVVLPAPVFSFELDANDIRPSIAIHCVFEWAAALDPVDSTALLTPAVVRSRDAQAGWYYTPSGGARTAVPVGGIPAASTKPITVEYESTITTPSQEIVYWTVGVDQT